VLGEEVDVAGLKQAIESPRPAEEPLAEAEEATLPFDTPGTPPSVNAPEPDTDEE